ncbi:MAG: hypothetical protein DSZ04_01845 [Sulfurimonas sp.]|nr:MAG: hypothetical protein DSZ04_01845 [Sulfurimonas sp.]
MTKMEKAIFGKNGYKVKTETKKPISRSKKKVNLPNKITAAEFNQHLYESMPEEEHQKELIKWLEKSQLYYEIGLEGIFLPNPHSHGSQAFIIQGASNRKVLSKMRAAGMKKGVSDIKVYLKRVCLHIELKRCDGGTISIEQRKTHDIVNNMDYCVHKFCNGYKEAKAFVSSYLAK